MKENVSKPLLVKVAVCFFLSGMAALLYQTAWMRQLSVVFGTSELAVATVLTAYMSGLALGAAVAAKYVHKISRPLLTYGVLEGGIAIRCGGLFSRWSSRTARSVWFWAAIILFYYHFNCIDHSHCVNGGDITVIE